MGEAMNKRIIGAKGEEKAVNYLIEQGLTILETNYVCKIGEIDIIAKQENIILFIEVKYRKNDKMGRPYESVNYHKQMKIMKSAMLYAQEMNLFNKAMRFDVIEIIGEEVNWFKNAFELRNNLKFL